MRKVKGKHSIFLPSGGYGREDCSIESLISQSLSNSGTYHNFTKFSDGQIRANSADPDQTALRGAVCLGSV